MDISIIKPFVNRDVEVLVGGVWIEGHMTPIAKGIITLLPIGGAENFYGPCACTPEVIQAIRLVKSEARAAAATPQTDPTKIRSSLDNSPGNFNFVVVKDTHE